MSNQQNSTQSIASTKVTFNLMNRPVSIQIQSESNNNKTELSAKVHVNGSQNVDIVHLGVSCIKGNKPAIHINFVVLENLREGLMKVVGNSNDSNKKLEVLKKIVGFLFCHVIEHINKNVYKNVNADIPVILHIAVAHKNNPILIHIAEQFGLIRNEANFRSSTKEILAKCKSEKEKLIQKFFEETQTLTGTSELVSASIEPTETTETTSLDTDTSNTSTTTDSASSTTDTTSTTSKNSTSSTNTEKKSESIFNSFFGSQTETPESTATDSIEPTATESTEATASPTELTATASPTEATETTEPTASPTEATATEPTTNTSSERLSVVNQVVKDLQGLIQSNKKNNKKKNTVGGQYGYYRTRPTFYL